MNCYCHLYESHQAAQILGKLSVPYMSSIGFLILHKKGVIR